MFLAAAEKRFKLQWKSVSTTPSYLIYPCTTGLEKNIKTQPPQIVDSWTAAILDDGGVAAVISTPSPPYWHEKGAGKSNPRDAKTWTVSWVSASSWDTKAKLTKRLSLTPAGWQEYPFPCEASEVETHIITKKWVFAEDSNFSIFIHYMGFHLKCIY